MPPPRLADRPRPPPEPVRALCARLEAQGVPAWRHGDGLLADALEPAGPDASPPADPDPIAPRPHPTRSLLCAADARALLDALPDAVVTASERRRITVATAWGPVDLLPIGPAGLEPALRSFGLGAYALAWRAAEDRWCDPCEVRAELGAGRLGTTGAEPDPFRTAPRRVWIAARLLAEHDLEPTPALVEVARRATAADAPSPLPLGAPSRRELERVLFARAPARGLAFLRATGAIERVLKGRPLAAPRAERWIGRLPPVRGLRWAAWLRGAPIQRACASLAMPPARAATIGRLAAAHPLDARLTGPVDGGQRRLLQRFGREELDGLLAWRRLELASTGPDAEAQASLEDAVRRLETLRAERVREARIHDLALDGRRVMEILGLGPGPHVGRALAHLAGHVDRHPEANEPAALEAALREWAAREAAPDEAGAAPRASSRRLGRSAGSREIG